MRQAPGIVAGILLVAGLSGCQAGLMPAVGDWISLDAVDGNFNTIDIGRNFTGDATIYFYLADDTQLYYADFEVEVTDSVVSGNDHTLIFDMQCDGNCSDFDFTMPCDLSRDEDELECEGEKVWEDYAFLDFERD